MQDFLDEVNLEIRRNMWLMQAGAPPHSANRIKAYLTERFGRRWIGRDGPVIWPAMSPDLNLCDFFL